MRNFIGSILIGLARIITFLRTVLLFLLVIGLAFGILIITMIAFFELFGRLIPTHAQMPFDLFGKWYWEVIVVFIGGATMWQGIDKMTEDTKKLTKQWDGWNETPNYNENP